MIASYAMIGLESITVNLLDAGAERRDAKIKR
jgi:hypothetical protein